MDQTSTSASFSGSEDPNASVSLPAPPPPASVADQGLSQFLAAQTQLMSTVMQSMNQMMNQQNQAAAALVNLVNQQNQSIAALIAMVNQNPQFAALPPPPLAISALKVRSEEPSPKEIHPEALSIEAPCRQQDIWHKRKMLSQEQEAAGSSKAQVIQSQSNKIPATATPKAARSAPCPQM